MNRRPRFAAIFLLFLPLVFSSCLDLNTDLRVRRDGRVRATLTYTIPGAVAEFGRYPGADEPWPIPITERDFALRAAVVEGVALERYRSSERRTDDGAGVESTTVVAVLEAETMDHLGEYFNADISYRNGGEGGSFTYVVRPPGLVLSPRLLTGLEEVVKGGTLTFRLKPPKAPLTSLPGAIVQGRAVWSISLGDVLNSDEGLDWTVNW